jgi:hypothetical protein
MLKSDRNFSINGVEPGLHLDEVLFDSVEALSDLLWLLRGCVAAAVLGMTTWTISHSKASWPSLRLAVPLLDFLELAVAGVACVLIQLLTSPRTVFL